MKISELNGQSGLPVILGPKLTAGISGLNEMFSSLRMKDTNKWSSIILQHLRHQQHQDVSQPDPVEIYQSSKTQKWVEMKENGKVPQEIFATFYSLIQYYPGYRDISQIMWKKWASLDVVDSSWLKFSAILLKEGSVMFIPFSFIRHH